jgi:hypothetical protein
MSQPQPKFRVLDEVVPAGETEKPTRLAITSVRRYRDGSHRYSIAAVNAPGDEREGLYDEEELSGTGSRSDLEAFAPPGAFTVRDIVIVSASHPDPDIAGEEAEVDNWTDDGQYLVWVPAREHVWGVEACYLEATGRRLSPPERRRPVTSLQVSTSGSVLGSEDYLIVEDIEDLL